MKQGDVVLPRGTMCFPCEEVFGNRFMGWHLEDEESEPNEPKRGWLLTYDCLLPTETWMPILKVVQDEKTKRVLSMRLTNRPEVLREHGNALTPDENGIRVFRASDEEAACYELSHYAALAPNGDVWILDEARSRVLVVYRNDGGN